jgi:hypothetical protein
MSGIQALAAAAAATSKMNTPGTATTLTTSSGQAIKLIQQPGQSRVLSYIQTWGQCCNPFYP